MTNPNTIAQTLERARGLLSSLLDQHEVDQARVREPAPISASQLRNMMNHVANIKLRVADSGEDSANAAKRLRDFSKTIERYKPAALELVASLRSAADQLMVAHRPAAAA